MATSLPLFNQGFSGSKSPLLAHCTWFVGPLVPWSEVPAGPEAILGSACHRVAERSIEAKAAGRHAEAVSVAEIADEFELDDDQAERLMTIAGPLFRFIEHNARIGWRVEVPFAWDPFAESSRELEKGAHRDYSARVGNEIPMTLDLFSFLPETPGAGRRGLVLDFKSGWARVKPPESNRQLLSQACAAATAYGLDEVLLVVLRLEEGRVVPTEALIDAFAMEEHRAWMVAALEGSASATATPGPHCAGMYCPAKLACPATMEAVGNALAVLDVPEARIAVTKGFKFGVVTSPEHAAWMLDAIEIVKLGVNVAEGSLREYADKLGGIPCADGTVWKKTVGASVKPDLTRAEARAILEAHGALGAVSTEESLTWKDLSSLLGAAEAKKVRVALELAGAVTRAPRVSYKRG